LPWLSGMQSRFWRRGSVVQSQAASHPRVAHTIRKRDSQKTLREKYHWPHKLSYKAIKIIAQDGSQDIKNKNTKTGFPNFYKVRFRLQIECARTHELSLKAIIIIIILMSSISWSFLALGRIWCKMWMIIHVCFWKFINKCPLLIHT